MKHSCIALLLCLGLAMSMSSCFEETFITDNSAVPQYSLDTLRFDTVFTDKGSATLSFKIYNPHDAFLRIEKVQIKDPNSFFRLNIDGFSGNELSNIEVPPNDSTYAFVEVVIDPDAPLSVSPFIVEDQILFTTNGNEQVVHLQAFGQNANYIPFVNGSGGQSGFVGCNGVPLVFNDPKPYVIFGVFVVDSCELVIPAGARIHIHGGIAQTDSNNIYSDGIFVIGPNASLRIEGTADNPVIIQGDRIEPTFNVDSLSPPRGQWNRIQFAPGSRGNVIEHAIIRNGTIGVLVDSTAQLSMRNTRLYNHAAAGFVGRSASVMMENCLMYDNGGNNALMLLGGNYDFRYCTLGAFQKSAQSGASLAASNFQCNDSECEMPFVRPLRLNIRNSIITGSSRDEISLVDAFDGKEPSQFTYRIDHSIVKVDELLDNPTYTNFLEDCFKCLLSEDPLFIDPFGGDFHLDTLSIAEMKGQPIGSIRIDLENNQRDPENPDIGCYEYQPN